MTKFYTYAPQAKTNKPLATKPGTIVLKPGETLGFQKGKGYYAKPAATVSPYAKPPAPTGGPGTRPSTPPPVDPFAARTAAQVDAAATAQAQAGFTPQQEEIRRQQALAQQNALLEADKIRGFGTAASGLLGQLAPQAQEAFLRSSRAEGELGQGLATGVAGEVADRVAADQAFAESQGQSGGSTIDTPALHDTVYDLNGRIPGDTFAEQGAAMTQWGLAQVPIQLNATREQLDARMAQARQDQDQYAQQLIQLAAQFPGLKAQALQQLNQYELDKANYRAGQVNDAAARKINAGQLALQQRSERAQEKAAGINAANDTAALNYKWASLEFQTAKARAAAQAAAKKGKGIDVGASKLLGHIVYKDGTEDPSIKVKQTTSATDPAVKAKANRAKATATARVTAFKSATSLRGTPVAAPKGSKGKYQAAPGQGWGKGGVFTPAYPGAPATTNNPERAARSGGAANYADAQSKVWALIDGDGLMSRYGYSKEQVNAIINDALRRAGWKR